MGAKRRYVGQSGYYEDLAKAKEAERRSMLNMAWFYLDTLKDIVAGVYKVPVGANGKYVSGHPALVLKKYGLVSLASVGRPRISYWGLTDKGKEIYSKLIQSPIPT